MSSVGQRIRALRIEAGMTQEALGRASGVTTSTIQKLESGIQNPKASTLIPLAEALGVRPGDFFEEATA